MHKVLVNRLGGLSLPRKSVVRLTDRPDMTLDVYRGRKTTMQQMQQQRFHCAFMALTVHSRRSHCADSVLKTLVCTTERSLRQFYVLENETMPTKRRKEEGRERNAFGFLHSYLPRMM